MNNQSSVLNLSNHPDINDSSLDNILRKIPKKSNIKEINLSKTKITHLPKKETLLLFPNLEKLNLTNTLIQDNQDFITISYELQSIPKLYFLDINISNETDVKIILLSLPLLKEVNGQKVDINNMKITFQEELNLSTYKYICEFMQNLNKNNINFVKNFHDNLSSLMMNQCLLDINFHCDKYQNNYNLSIFHSLYKINQYLHKGLVDYLLIYGDKELDTNARNNIYNISLQICETMNFYEGLIRNISTSISIILDKIINENIEQYFKQKTKEVEKNIISKKKLLDEQINKDFHNRTFGNFDGNLTYNESMLDNSMNKKGNSLLLFDKNDKNEDLISELNEKYINNKNNNINNDILYNSKTSREKSTNKNQINDNEINKVNPNKKNSSKNNSDIIPLDDFINLINNIYESKEKEEKINIIKNQPQETLEHHIYTFLTRKYGVKHIVIEKAFSIFSSLRKYSNLNSDILLFAKIIRNDIDESSRLFSLEIKKNLEKFLMNKIIDDDIIKIISNSFYCDDNDNKIIFLKNINEKKTSKEVGVDDIYNIILEIEIKKRNLFLKNFKILFKRIDTDSDGIINSYDTSILFGNIFDEIKNDLINEGLQLDKNKFVDDLMNYFKNYIPKSLTFSQIIQCLENSNIKILEYLSIKQNIQENNNNDI